MLRQLRSEESQLSALAGVALAFIPEMSLGVRNSNHAAEAGSKTLRAKAQAGERPAVP